MQSLLFIAISTTHSEAIPNLHRMKHEYTSNKTPLKSLNRLIKQKVCNNDAVKFDIIQEQRLCLLSLCSVSA